MRSRAEIPRSKWNLLVVGIVVALVATTAAINSKLDRYGLFENVAGKKYVVYANERSTKFLLSYNYIPTNFDGLLVGPSISDNWDTGALSNFRIYNVSIVGGNITEEAIIVDNVLSHCHPKLILFLIYPSLTKSHGDQTGYMTSREYWGALGSMQLLQADGNKWLVHHGYAKQEFNEFGRDDFVGRFQGKNYQPPSNLVIDDSALKEYSELIRRARGSGAKIIGIIPPIKAQVWNANRAAYTNYYLQLRHAFEPTEPIIDLNDPEFTADNANFIDGAHLSTAAAKKVVSLIDIRLRRMQ